MNFLVELTSPKILIALLVLLILLRLFTVLAISFDAKLKNDKKPLSFIITAIFFPIISGIAYLAHRAKIIKADGNSKEENKSAKNLSVIFLLCSILSIVLLFLTVIMAGLSAFNNISKNVDETVSPSSSSYTQSSSESRRVITTRKLSEDEINYYDLKGNGYEYLSDVIYYDSGNNRYINDFDTVSCLDNGKNYEDKFSYVDQKGYFHYDSNKVIYVKDKHTCVDDKGNIFYPISFVRFDKNGKISCDLPDDLEYDRNKTAYIYVENVPFYDKNGNRCFYSFNSNTQKGNFSTPDGKVSYPSENAYVDSNGYLVYDGKNEFTLVNKDKAIGELAKYADKKGNTYYRASDITWDKNGKIIMRG